jgi:hypothetical protein
VTPREHREEAERFAEMARRDSGTSTAQLWALIAQVHATLATIPSDRVLTMRDDR